MGLNRTRLRVGGKSTPQIISETKRHSDAGETMFESSQRVLFSKVKQIFKHQNSGQRRAKDQNSCRFVLWVTGTAAKPTFAKMPLK